MQIVFMGTPDFAVPCLQALLDSKHEVIAVFTQPPRKSGRGQKLQKNPIHQLVESQLAESQLAESQLAESQLAESQLAPIHNIPVYTPKKLDSEAQRILKNLAPDAICVAAYGMLLPQAVLDIAPCINVHPSALPRWRGAAPLHHTILAGDKTTDICIMQMEKGLDNGAVYLRKSYDVGANETTGELHDRLSLEGGKMLVEVLDNWEILAKNPTAQSEAGLIYAHKFKPEDLPQIRTLDFSKSAKAVHNQIRGLSPWPGATAMHGDVQLKILGSQLVDTKTPAIAQIAKIAKAGEITAINTKGITIACGDNGEAITLTKLQKPSKKAMQAKDFLKGYDIKVGDLLK